MDEVADILSDPYEGFKLSGNADGPLVRDDRVIGCAVEIFMAIKELVLMGKLSGATPPDFTEGRNIQRHFAPTWHGHPYYWLRRPFIDEAIALLNHMKLIRRSAKQSDMLRELFGIGSVGLQVIHEEKTSDQIKARIRELLIDTTTPAS